MFIFNLKFCTQSFWYIALWYQCKFWKLAINFIPSKIPRSAQMLKIDTLNSAFPIKNNHRRIVYMASILFDSYVKFLVGECGTA